MNNFSSALITANGLNRKEISLSRVNRVLDEVTEFSVKNPLDVRVEISIKEEGFTIDPTTGIPSTDYRLTSGIYYIKFTNEHCRTSKKKFDCGVPFKFITDLQHHNYDLSGPVMFDELAKRVPELKWLKKNCKEDIKEVFEVAKCHLNYRVPITLKLETLKKSSYKGTTSEEYQKIYDDLALLNKDYKNIIKEVRLLPQVQEEMKRNEEEYKQR